MPSGCNRSALCLTPPWVRACCRAMSCVGLSVTAWCAVFRGQGKPAAHCARGSGQKGRHQRAHRHRPERKNYALAAWWAPGAERGRLRRGEEGRGGKGHRSKPCCAKLKSWASWRSRLPICESYPQNAPHFVTAHQCALNLAGERAGFFYAVRSWRTNGNE